MFNRSRFGPVWFCSLSGEDGINQLINEGQVDLAEGGGHQVVGDVQQVKILLRLVLQPEWREHYQPIIQ
jgi:hypothetical protein